MVSGLSDLLSESFLFDRAQIDEQYRKLSEKELENELSVYREHQLAQSPAVEKRVRDNSSNLKLFTGSTDPVLALLKQTALYLDQVVIADPVFPFTHPWSEHAKTMNEIVGLKSDGAIDRRKLALSAQYLNGLSPMLRANFVVTLPISSLFEPAKDIPFRASSNGFSDVLPQPLLDYYRERAIVNSVKKTDEGMIIDGTSEIGRSIYVRFKDHLAEDARGYLLMDQIVRSVDEEKLKIETISFMPEAPPDKARYDAWVYQSINQTAEHSYKRLLTENQLAAGFEASYLCTTPFTFELLEEFLPDDQSVPDNTVNSLLKFDLPFMDQIDTETLMRVRLEDGEAFQNFRNELDSRFRELRLVKDPDELRVKSENVWHEISNIQITKINQKVKHLESQLKVDIAIGAAALVGAVQTGGFSLIALGIAMAQGYRSYKEYQFQRQQNPSFFLWKTLRG